MNKQVSRRTRMQLAFGSAVVLLLLCGLATYDAVVRLRDAQKWVSHTRDVQSTLADLNNCELEGGTSPHPVRRYRRRFVSPGLSIRSRRRSREIAAAPATYRGQSHAARRLEASGRRYQSQVGPVEPIDSVETRRSPRRSRAGAIAGGNHQRFGGSGFAFAEDAG